MRAPRLLRTSFLRPLSAPLLLVLGCAPFGRSSGHALAGTEWTLVALEGEAPVGSAPLTLDFGEGTLGGYGGCNQFGGSYRASDGSLDIGPVQSTLRACADEGVTAQEARFHDALGRVRGYRVQGGTLDLSDEGGPCCCVSRRALPATDVHEVLRI